MSKASEKTEFEKKLELKAAKEQEQRKEKDRARPSSGTQAASEELPQVAPSAAAGPDVQGAALQQEIAQLGAECESLRDQLLRVRADFDNYRKRTQREGEQLRQQASAKVISALLPVLDNLERALSHAPENDGLASGVRMVSQQLQDVLSAEGLAPIPTAGLPFDPNIHEALCAQPSNEVEAGNVLEEFERGYMLHDRVLRPSRVIVSIGMPEENDEASDDTTPDAMQEPDACDPAAAEDAGNGGPETINTN